MRLNPLLRPALAAQPVFVPIMLVIWWGLRLLIILRFRTYLMRLYPLISVLLFLAFGIAGDLPPKTNLILFILWPCWGWPTIFNENAKAYSFNYELVEAQGLRRWRTHYDQMLLAAVEGLDGAKGEYYLLDCGHTAPVYSKSPLELGSSRPCSLHREYPRQSTVLGLSFDSSKDYQLVPSSRH